MSEVIRSLLTGKGMSRRDFLKGMGAFAASASGVPMPSPAAIPASPQSAIAASLPRILKRVQLIQDPAHGDVLLRDIIDELPNGQINDPVEQARYAAAMGKQIQDTLGISREDYVTLVQEANEARRQLEQAGALPTMQARDGSPNPEPLGVMQWNPSTKQWESRFRATRRVPRSEEDIASERAHRQALKQRGDYETLADMGPLSKWNIEASEFDNIEQAAQFGEVMPSSEMLWDEGPHGISTLQNFGFAYGHAPDPRAAMRNKPSGSAQPDANHGAQAQQKSDSQWPFIDARFGKVLSIGAAAAMGQRDQKQSPVSGLLGER